MSVCFDKYSTVIFWRGIISTGITNPIDSAICKKGKFNWKSSAERNAIGASKRLWIATPLSRKYTADRYRNITKVLSYTIIRVEDTESISSSFFVWCGETLYRVPAIAQTYKRRWRRYDCDEYAISICELWLRGFVRLYVRSDEVESLVPRIGVCSVPTLCACFQSFQSFSHQCKSLLFFCRNNILYA